MCMPSFANDDCYGLLCLRGTLDNNLCLVLWCVCLRLVHVLYTLSVCKKRARYAFETYENADGRKKLLSMLCEKKTDYKSIRQLAVYGNVFPRMESLLFVFYYTKILSYHINTNIMWSEFINFYIDEIPITASIIKYNFV